MMSKTSSTKINKFSNMMWFTTRQNIGLMILSAIATLIIYPGYLSIDISTLGYYDRKYNFNGELEAYCILLMIACCGLVAIYNLINFMYLYSKKSSDVFHAVPLKRTQLLLSRGLSSLICTAVPLIIGYISLFSIVLFNNDINSSLTLVVGMFIYTILYILVVWAITLFFMICSGSVFDYIISCGIVNISLISIPAIIDAFANDLLFGYSSSIYINIAKWTSPIVHVGNAISNFIDTGYGYFHHYSYDSYLYEYSYSDTYKFGSRDITAIIYTVVFLSIIIFATLYLYKRRKAEKSGAALAFKFIYIATSVLLSYQLAYLLGSIFSNISSYNYSVIFWIFAVIMGLLTAVAYGAITSRGFKTVKKSLILGGIGILCLLITFLSIEFDATRFETRVPNEKNIESVEVYLEYSNEEYIELTGEEIKLATDLHKKIIDKYKTAPEIFNEEFRVSDAMTAEEVYLYSGRGYQFSYSIASYVIIDYNLKNGNVFSRAYRLPHEYFETELIDMLKTDDLSNVTDALNKTKPKNVRFEYNEINSGYSAAYYLKYDDVMKLIDTYLSDLNSLTELGEYYTDVNIRWSGNEQYDFYIMVPDNFTQTIELIEDFSNDYADLNEDYVTY